jgi:hypothetical protein
MRWGSPSSPQTWNRYAYARDNPILYIDPDGKEDRKGSQAGTIFNFSGSTIWVSADVAGTTYVIPLEFGESSQSYFEDADAIIVQYGQNIDGEASGAFKIGGADVEIENGDSGSLELIRDGEYPLYFSAGRAGHFSSAFANSQKWIIPQTKEEVNKSMEDKKMLYQKRAKDKAEEKKKEEESKKNANKKTNSGKK